MTNSQNAAKEIKTKQNDAIKVLVSDRSITQLQCILLYISFLISVTSLMNRITSHSITTDVYDQRT